MLKYILTLAVGFSLFMGANATTVNDAALYRIFHGVSNDCLDSGGGGNTVYVYHNCSDSNNPYQQWRIETTTYDGQKYSIFRNVKYETKCLDSNMAPTPRVYQCNNHSLDQLFTFETVGPRSFTLQSIRYGLSQCFDSNGKEVYMHQCNGGSYQKWRLEPAPST